ncbi:MAG: hypothetical protein K8R64_07780 [Methanosarcinaceae archaeon]|nr:hypothetical protein [Methanosarcinaceae archaeon]
MTDVMLVWDAPLLFEKLFTECDLKCQRILSIAIGTPFLPPCKCLVIPTGFANPSYTKVLQGIEANARAFERFVQEGGTLVVFGAVVPEYRYDWLPFELEYVGKHGATLLVKSVDHDTRCIVDDPAEPVECDGYFSHTDGQVIFKNSDDQPVMVAQSVGDGLVVATTIHEFPTTDFIRCVVGRAKRTKIQ